jgi:hypothetical protein
MAHIFLQNSYNLTFDFLAMRLGSLRRPGGEQRPHRVCAWIRRGNWRSRNDNMSMVKKVNITERLNIELHADMFNLFNHANFFLNDSEHQQHRIRADHESELFERCRGSACHAVRFYDRF